MTTHTREQPLDEARATLGEAMTTSREWQERQLCNDYAEPGPDIITPPSKTAKRVAILVVAMVIGGIVLGMCAAGRAAERGDHMRPHEITLLVPPGTAAVGIMTISAAYPDRASCEKAKQRVVVRAPGAKLVCGIVNPFRVK